MTEPERLQVGAVPTSEGWLVISLTKDLVMKGVESAVTHGDVTINGVRFEMRKAK